MNIVKDVPENDNMDDLKRELASLRLDDEPPRSRRGAWVLYGANKGRRACRHKEAAVAQVRTLEAEVQRLKGRRRR